MYIKPRNDPKPVIPIKKKYVILVFIIFGLAVIDYGSCRATEVIDYHGITVFYGHSDWTNIGPEPIDKHEWYNISYFLGKDIHPWLSLETSLGPGYIKTANYNETGSLEWRLLFNIHHKYLYFKLGTGVAYLLESANMPDLSDSSFFSIVSGSVGFRFSFNDGGKNNPEILLGYSVEHLSDAFKRGEEGDFGMNAGAIKAIISWKF